MKLHILLNLAWQSKWLDLIFVAMDKLEMCNMGKQVH